MEYHEAANALFALRRYAPRPGTDATAALLSHLGDPQADLRCVQVAGSNGKGSTARMLASILREAGLTVGLYTSPHLDDVRERIRVDGRPISKAALVTFVETAEGYLTGTAADGTSPTFFETLTALALWEFDRQGVDVAVLEVGIGGTHDATSAVEPIASAVTSVTLEHTDVLGDTVAEIARDKAGVAPADRPLVTGATGPALDAIQDAVEDVLVVGGDGPSLAAHAAGSEEREGGTDDAPDVDPAVTVTGGGRDGLEGVVEVAGPDWDLDARLALLGAHQARNAGIAATLARQVVGATGSELESATIGRGLRNAHWPGRFEVMGRDPLVVLDGAHNPGGCGAVADTLATFEFDALHVVVGAMADKNLRGMARALPAPDSVSACQPDRERAQDSAAVARAFETETDAAVVARTDVRAALDAALDEAAPGDCVLVVGSLYAVAEARTRWARTRTPVDVETLSRARATLEGADVTDAGVWRMRGKAVHRVLRTRVRPRQARYLKEELLSLGGECAVAGLRERDEEPIPVVTMGTLAQFKRLVEKLDDQPYGLASLGDELRETLDIGSGPDRGSPEYPWTSDRTAVMGVLNVTPDSFYDGGEFAEHEDAIARAEEMVAAGADIVDVGGESTRPGAEPVPTQAEIDRVVPVIEAIADLDALVSIDTRKAAVARAALEAGADVLNDVSGLADPEMRHVAAADDVPVVVMHSIDAPVVPGTDVHYDDVVGDVVDELTERVLLAEKAGLDRSQIIVDPGLGFGKTAAESFELLDRLGEFRALDCPILVGHSRKSMFDRVDRGPGDRLQATVAASALAAERGADIVRVHDVAANRAAVDVTDAARDAGVPEVNEY